MRDYEKEFEKQLNSIIRFIHLKDINVFKNGAKWAFENWVSQLHARDEEVSFMKCELDQRKIVNEELASEIKQLKSENSYLQDYSCYLLGSYTLKEFQKIVKEKHIVYKDQFKPKNTKGE